MAAYLKLVTLLFLISSLIFLSSVDARDSQFFSKEVRNAVAAKETDPKETPEATPATSTLDSETNNGYGLYGREGANNQEFTNNNNYYNKFGEDVNSQDQFTNDNNYDSKFDEGVNNQEFTNNNNYDSKFDNQDQFTSNKKFEEESEEFPAAEEDNSSNEFPSDDFFNNAEFTEKYDQSKDEEDEQSSRYGARGVNRGYQQRQPSNKYAPKEYKYKNQQFRSSNQGYPQETPEHYGMSDTRLVENGKYFYDVKNQNHGSAYAAKTLPESGGYYGSSLKEYFNNYKPEEQPAGEYLP